MLKTIKNVQQYQKINETPDNAKSQLCSQQKSIWELSQERVKLERLYDAAAQNSTTGFEY